MLLIQLNTWFKSNLLSLNLDKTHFLQFLTKNSHESNLQISYKNKQISKIYNTKFLGVVIDNNLSWGFHIDEIIPKLNKAYYVIRSVKPFISLEVLTTFYFSLVNLIITYGLIFWGTSDYSRVIFKIQKRIFRVIMNSNSKDSCRDLLKNLCILPLHAQYIFSILLFVVKNIRLFKTDFDVHKFNTRSNYDLHLPTAKLTVFQKGVCYSGIKIYNHLPLRVKQLSHDINKFKSALKRFLLTNSLYTLDFFFKENLCCSCMH
jgi:hypothetical protein